MSDYWLGVLTVPAVVLTLALVGYATAWTSVRLARAGWFAHFRWSRGDSISDYTLRHDIWWERAFGPIFIGGWYHEQLRYELPSLARINRWVGLGHPEGPHLMVGRSRELGEADQ